MEDLSRDGSWGPCLHKTGFRKKFLPFASSGRNGLKILINRRPLDLMVFRTCKKSSTFFASAEVVTAISRIRCWSLSRARWIQSTSSHSTSRILRLSSSDPPIRVSSFFLNWCFNLLRGRLSPVLPSSV